MGGLAGSLFDLFEGDPAQQERNQFGALANYQTGVGEGLTTAGAGVEEAILSGDPTRIAQVEAPEITAQRQQIEQQNLQNANFGTRSGGTAASTQAADAAGRANIINLTGQLVGGTAGAAVGQGEGLLSGASSNIGQEANLAEERRKQVVGDIGNVAQGAGQIVEAIAGGGIPTGAASDPFQSLYSGGLTSEGNSALTEVQDLAPTGSLSELPTYSMSF